MFPALRPDVVLWSARSRVVILLELTCPAEEGIAAAQVRKTSRYKKLQEDIDATNTWKARLLTLEVGARGLVGSSTYRAFRVLGFSAAQTKSLVKALSEIVVRCSYAIYLAHNSPVWPHNDDLVCSRSRATNLPRILFFFVIVVFVSCITLLTQLILPRSKSRD